MFLQKSANQSNDTEQIEEEDIRIDFVAFTRAKKDLYIITRKASDFESEITQSEELEVQEEETFTQIKAKKAFAQFLAQDHEGAKESLDDKNSWIVEHLTDQLKSIDRLSFSVLNTDPYKFMIWNVLNIREPTPALQMGTDVHEIAENLLKETEYTVSEEQQQYVNNIQELIEQINKEYPEVHSVEEYFRIPAKEIFGVETELEFSGKIDAIFKNKDKYLVVDWKTDSNESRAAKHRQQLAVYKAAFCAKNNIDPENVQVAIGYVGLREKINDGKINCLVDMKQPAASAINTATKHVEIILEWINNPETLITAFKNKPQDETLYKTILEEITV